MNFKRKYAISTTIVAILLLSGWVQINAGCNSPSGLFCTFTVRAEDANNRTRVAYSGGSLHMVGVSRNAYIYAEASGEGTFDGEEYIPHWWKITSSNWADFGYGPNKEHTGGTAIYEAVAWGDNKLISIVQHSPATTTLSLEGKAGLKTIAASLNDYADKLGIDVSAKEPTITGTYAWKWVEKNNSPQVAKHHTVSIDCSAGLEWDEVKIPGLAKTIDLGPVEIACGVFSGGDIIMSIEGSGEYNPNSVANQDIDLTGAITGSSCLKLKGSCEIETWWIDAAAGAEVSGTFILGASATATINETGISSSNAKFTYKVKLQGKAYASVNGISIYRDWTYEPQILQGECPITFGYNFGG